MRTTTRICRSHPVLTVVVWIALLLGLTVAAQLRPGPTSNDYSIPESASAHAQQMLVAHDLDNPDATTTQVVLHDPDGLAAHGPAITAYTAGLVDDHPGWEARPGPDDGYGLSEVSADGTTGYLDLTVSDSTMTPDQVTEAFDALSAAAPKAAGLQLEYAGDLAPAPSSGPGEGLGMLAAVVILLIAFGSLFAMAVPVVVAAFGAGTGVMLLGLTGHLIDLPGAAAALAMMLAVGVGIDYSLLIVTRYRELLKDGRSVPDAVDEAMATAGHSVLVAGMTVVVAVLGLLLMGMPLVNGIAIGAALAIAMTMLAALTLLPALLQLLGTRIEKWGLPSRMRPHPADDRGLFARWATGVQRHRVAGVVASLLVLLVLTVPALDLRLGFGDDGALPGSTTQRRAHDLMAEHFGPGTLGPLVIAVDTSDVSGADEESALEELRVTLTGTAGVEQVEGPFVSDDGQAAAAIVLPTSGPDDVATENLVHTLRDDVLPAQPLAAGVTGTTAAAVDFAEATQQRLPFFIAVVLAVAFVLLAWTYRSVLVPLKAVLMNLLSIGAAFGVVVAVVQWGWLAGLLGFEAVGPVTAWVPMMLVAVVFGLSMDYEVFLLSRIREFHDRGESNQRAVTLGLARTGRVITAAAAIMVCVFGGFLLGADPELKVFGLGLAVAVLIDATLVRMVLVPAAMALMGEANWWAPRWMRRPASRGWDEAAEAELAGVDPREPAGTR